MSNGYVEHIVSEFTNIEDGLPTDQMLHIVDVIVVVQSQKDDRGFKERDGYFMISKEGAYGFHLSNGQCYFNFRPDDWNEVIAWMKMPEYKRE